MKYRSDNQLITYQYNHLIRSVSTSPDPITDIICGVAAQVIVTGNGIKTAPSFLVPCHAVFLVVELLHMDTDTNNAFYTCHPGMKSKVESILIKLSVEL